MVCPECDGSGQDGDEEDETCFLCDGTGRICARCEDPINPDQGNLCAVCKLEEPSPAPPPAEPSEESIDRSR